MRKTGKPRQKRSKERYPKPRLQSSAELTSFALYFIQGFDRIFGGTTEEVLEKAIASFRGEARLRFRKYLDDITDERFSDAELTRLWNSTPANIYLAGPGGPRAFFKGIRDRL